MQYTIAESILIILLSINSLLPATNPPTIHVILTTSAFLNQSLILKIISVDFTFY